MTFFGCRTVAPQEIQVDRPLQCLYDVRFTVIRTGWDQEYEFRVQKVERINSTTFG